MSIRVRATFLKRRSIWIGNHTDMPPAVSGNVIINLTNFPRLWMFYSRGSICKGIPSCMPTSLFGLSILLYRAYMTWSFSCHAVFLVQYFCNVELMHSQVSFGFLLFMIYFHFVIFPYMNVSIVLSLHYAMTNSHVSLMCLRLMSLPLFILSFFLISVCFAASVLIC